MKLENAIKLSHRVTVYVPSLRQDGTPTASYADECAGLLSDLFGGATSTDAVGYWRHHDGPLAGTVAREHVRMVFAYASTLEESDIDTLYQWIVDLKARADQEAVALEINGELYIV